MSKIETSESERLASLIETAKEAFVRWDDAKADKAALEARDIVHTWVGELGQDARSARELSKICLEVAGVLTAVERFSMATALIEAGLAMVEPLAQSAPADLDVRGIVWDAHMQSGAVSTGLLDTPRALVSYQNGLAIAERTVASHPLDAEWQRKLSVASMRIGYSLSEEGLRTEALAAMTMARTLAERRLKAEPDNEDRQHDLAGAYIGLAGVHMRMGRWQKARDCTLLIASLIPSKKGNKRWDGVRFHNGTQSDALDKARHLGIERRLVDDDPRQPDWEGSWVDTSGIVSSNVRLKSDDWAGWLESYQSSLTILQKRAYKAPGQPDLRRDLSLLLERIGHLHAALGQAAEASAAFEACLALRAGLAQSDPANLGWQRDLAVICAKLGLACGQAGHKHKAQEVFAAGREAIARALTDDPYLTAWADDLAWFDHHGGRSC